MAVAAVGRMLTSLPRVSDDLSHFKLSLLVNPTALEIFTFILLTPSLPVMVTYYDELEIEDFAWDPVAKVFHHPCPCGDRFEITKSQLRDGEEIAICPSCSLIVRIVYDYVSPKSRV